MKMTARPKAHSLRFLPTVSRVLSACILWALTSGCNNVFNSSSGSFGGNLNSVTNVTRKGEIAANLESIEVDNQFGAVNIVAAGDGPGEWSWTLTLRAKNDSLAKEAADAVNCKADQTGGLLRLLVSLPNLGGKLNIRSDLEIRVPKSVDVRTMNRFGNTTISGLKGDVDATGKHGAVNIQNIGGKVKAQTSFASMTVSDVGPAALKNQHGGIEATHIRGALDAETSFASLVAKDIGGPVTLRNQHGGIEVVGAKGNADLKTSFASLSAEKIAGLATFANQNGSVKGRDITGSVKASTSFAPLDVESGGAILVCRNQHGSIRLRSTSHELAKVDAVTSFGSLEVHLPSGMKPAIQASTSFAKVESDFPVLMKPAGQDPFAEVEPGTPRVSLQNQNGLIRILREAQSASR